MSDDQGLGAFTDFRSRLQTWGARYKGAWFCGVALRRERDSGEYGLALARVLLKTPGVLTPNIPPGRFLELPGEAIGVTRELSDKELAELEAALNQNAIPTFLREEFGKEVVVPPVPPNNVAWSCHVDRYGHDSGWPALHLERYGGGEFHQLFGHPRLERVNTALKRPRVGVDGFKELGERLRCRRFYGSNYTSQQPIIEITAELPLAFRSFDYDARRRAFVAEIRAGERVSLDPGVVTLLKGLTGGMPLSNCEQIGTAETGVKRMEAVFPTAKSTSAVKAALIYGELELGEKETRSQEASVLVSSPRRHSGGPGADLVFGADNLWEGELRDEYHVTRRQLAGSLRKVLPPATAEHALRRVRDSLLMAKAFPFWALASSASIVEVVLRAALGRVSDESRSEAWTKLGKAQPKGSATDYRLAQAIECATALGLLRGEDLLGSQALRKLRNGIHIELDAPRIAVSPADARAALAAAITVIRSVARHQSRG